MSFNGKLIVSIAIFLLVALSAYGVNFGAEIESPSTINRITLDESAKVRLTIYNYGDKAQEFTIKSPITHDWDIYTEPAANPITLEVPANGNASIDLLIKPNAKYVAQGAYQVTVTIESVSSGESITVEPRISVVSSKDTNQGYVPTVTASTNFPETVDPRKQVSFNIVLTNQNKLNIQGAKLILSSQFMNEEKTINLAPEEEQIVEVSIKFDSSINPVQDKLQIRLLYNDKDVFSPIVKSYSIASFSDISQTMTEKKTFMGKAREYTIVNNGNSAYTAPIRIEVSPIRKIFSSTQPKGKFMKENGKYYYSWDANIPPQSKTTVTVKENYSSLLLLILLIGLVAAFLMVKKKTMAITKEVAEVDSEDGHLSRVKVILNVKNVSGKAVQNISVIDKIPNLLALEKDTAIGSLKPAKTMKNAKNETLVVWDIESLSPSEERVITYFLRSKLKIIGGFNLQPAVVKYKINNSEARMKSNIAIVKP